MNKQLQVLQEKYMFMSEKVKKISLKDKQRQDIVNGSQKT